MLNLNSYLGLIFLVRTSNDSSSMDPTLRNIIVSLVVILIFLISLVFLRRRVFPIFRLWYIILVYGKFSFEFIEFFKEHNLRNPHNNCIRDEITMHFVPFFKKMKNAEHFITKTKLEFGEVKYLSSYKNLVRQKGNPECINTARMGDSRVKVVGFNELLGGIKMKSLYYFIDERFVMGEYLFTEMQSIKPTQIVGTLSSKYLDHQTLNTDLFYITDPMGNELFYENNGFSINLKYLFVGDKEINDLFRYIFPSGEMNGINVQKGIKDEDLFNRF